jgi:anti-sigma B factor antagonist
VAVEEFASTAVVRAEGDIDLASVHELTAALDGVELGSITLLVVDLDEVGFLDLSGLNAILKLNEECRGNGVHLSVIAPRGPGKRVFTLTRTDRELDLVDAGVRADR